MEVVVADLRRCAGLLLDPGVAAAGVDRARIGVAGTIGAVLEDCRILVRLVPRLLSELGEVSSSVDTTLVASPIPRRAVPSRRLRDYVPSGNTLLPKTWYTAVPALEPDPRPLTWVLWLIERLVARLGDTRRRLDRMLSDAHRARAVESVFAQRESEALRELELRLDTAASQLRRAELSILHRGSWRLAPSGCRPEPYPTGAAWSTLRAISGHLSDKREFLHQTLTTLLRAPVHVADRGFLFQRWVGLKLIEALEGFGFVTEGDRVQALFLGGRLGLRREGVELDLWCDPRLVANHPHPSGLRVTRHETTPDFVLLTPGSHGKDAFVLDATLSLDLGIRSSKARYLHDLELEQQTRIAGVPVRLHSAPLRAWAAAPLRRPICDLSTPDGRSGTVPMPPSGYDSAPLRAWLQDIVDHASAWKRE